MMPSSLYKSIGLFIIAGLCEVIGGYMVWRAIKDQHLLFLVIPGGVLLAAYAAIATFQPAAFGRTYAAYGGVFIIMSLLWAWVAEKTKPDIYDAIGTLIVLAGSSIIFYTPRNN